MDDDYFDNAPTGGWGGSARNSRVRSLSAREEIVTRNHVSFELARKRDERAQRARERAAAPIGSVGLALLAAIEAKRAA